MRSIKLYIIVLTSTNDISFRFIISFYHFEFLINLKKFKLIENEKFSF